MATLSEAGARSRRCIASPPASLAAAVTRRADGARRAPSGSQAAKGGTLYYLELSRRPSTSTRSAPTSGVDIANFSRLVYRSLVTFPISTDPTKRRHPGPRPGDRHRHRPATAPRPGRSRSRTASKWQDGKPITCEDFKYGVSRTFATDVITGGPNYILGYLDIPTGADGLPAYKGPYTGDRPGRLRQGRHLRRQHHHVPLQEAVAGLPARRSPRCTSIDPYRADQDKGDKSNFAVFSNGPYKLDGARGTRTRAARSSATTKYDPTTDDTKIREANPDKIVFQIGNATETIYDRLIADAGDDQNAITDRRACRRRTTAQITG